MKRPLLLFLSCLLPLALQAQKVRFTDTTNRWTTLFFSGAQERGAGRFTTYLYLLSGDTVVSGNHYKFLRIGPPYTGSSISPRLLVRDDVAAQKVFTRALDTGSGPKDTVLYDYTLQVGDTITRAWSNHRTKFYVQSVDSVIIQGVYHRVWNMAGLIGTGFGSTTTHYSVIEGIGSTCGPWFPFAPYTFENTWTLACFESHGTSPSVGSAVDGYFDNSASCTLSVDDVQQQAPAVQVVPDPARQQLEFRLPYRVNRGRLSVYNLTGGEVYAQALAGTDRLSFAPATVPCGVYLYRITATDRSAVFYGRFEIH